MNFAIIEDEPYSAESLKFTMQKLYPAYKLAFMSATIAESVEQIKANPQLDLIFMDIELADGNSFDIFKEVNVAVPVIFTTSYNEYAVQAFKVNSIDYLLKPFSDADLALAITKFERYQERNKPAIPQELIQQLSMSSKRPMRIRIEAGDNYKYVNLDEVAYFLSEDKYVLAVLKTGRKVITSFANLQDLEDLLPESEYFRVTRSVVASIGSIKSVSKFFRGRLSVIIEAGNTEERVMISSTRREAFLNWLGA